MAHRRLLIGMLVFGCICGITVLSYKSQHAQAAPVVQNFIPRNLDGLSHPDYGVDAAEEPSVGPNVTFLPCVSQLCPPFYTEDFSNPATGWPVGDSAKVKYAYVNGEYQIMTKVPGDIHGVIVEAGDSNFQVEVDTHPASQLDGGLGIVFNWVGTDRSYIFEIKDGHYRLFIRDTGTQTPIINWTPNSALNQGYGSNHITVIRNVTSIKLIANGHVLNTITDSTFNGTWVGIISHALATPNFDGRFDNFTIYTTCTNLNGIQKPLSINELSIP